MKHGGLRRRCGWIRRLLLQACAVCALMTLGCALRGYRWSYVDDGGLGTMPAVQKAAERLAIGLRYPTVEGDDEAFTGYLAFLKSAYPHVFDSLQTIRFGDSILLIWPGTSEHLQPALFLGHMDVVPIQHPELWKHPPFSGELIDGKIWGRGARDDKVAVQGLLEAAEHLLLESFKPERTLLIFLGADEETGGHEGAARAAEWVEEHYTRLWLILDEGLAVTQGLVPGISSPVALVGVSEKGYADVELRAEVLGGHSSMPPNESASVRMAQALSALSKAPMRANTSQFIATMRGIAPRLPWLLRMMLKQRWVFGQELKEVLSEHPALNASIRTTITPTVITAGHVENVVPTIAKANLNVRIAPWDSIVQVLDHIRDQVRPFGVTVTLKPGANPAAQPSPLNAGSFEVLATAIRDTFPNTLLAPAMALSATDSRYFRPLCDFTYRFVPMLVTPEEEGSIHGVNESIGIDEYWRGIGFYKRVLRLGGLAAKQGLPRLENE